MAKVKTNPIIEQIRGKVGDLVFKRYGDSVILARVPDTENREVTPAQAGFVQSGSNLSVFCRSVCGVTDESCRLKTRLLTGEKRKFYKTRLNFVF